MHIKSFLYASAAVLAVPCGTAFAQGTDAGAPAETSTQIQDIVVTARRTEESLQTTPIAVTALNAEALAVAKVETVVDLQRTAPGLVVGRGSAGSDGIVFVAIRGQGNLQPILANDPAVGTYIDGIYMPRPSAGQTDIQDIQRIEVLRGPQGTLFGRNTTGGALNFITADPSQEFEGLVKAEYGKYNNLGLQAVVNAPIAENLALRVTGAYRNRDGFARNPDTDRDFWDLESKLLRGKLKYEGEGWDVTLSADWNKTFNHGQQSALEAVNTAIIPGAFLPAAGNFLDRSAWWETHSTGTTQPLSPANQAILATLPANVQARYGVQPFNKLEVYGFGGIVNVELGELNFKSITGYRHTETSGLSDTDATPQPILATFASSKSHYFSQEIQLSGNITDSFSFITGGYYGSEAGDEISRSQIFGGLIRDSNADVKSKTFGLYGQVYYKFTDTLRAVAGFRYTWDKRDTVLHNAQILGLPYNAVVAGTPTGINCTIIPTEPVTADTCNREQSAKFNYPAWNFGIDWQAGPDVFLYAATRAAAKAGGWNLRAGGLPAFAPEKVKDVEAGAKIDLFDRHVRLNLAAFHTWKKDNQAIVNAFVPGIGVTQYIQNNGKVRIWGLETELTVLPWEGMTITGNASLQDGKYVKGTYQETQVIAGSGCTNPDGVANGCVVDLSGLPLLQLPKKQFNISATQSLPTGSGTFAATLAYAYVGPQHFNAVRAAAQQSPAAQAAYATENRLGRVSGYGLLNGRVSYTFDQPDVEVAFYARNIFSNRYVVRRFSDLYRQLGLSIAYVGEPATFGGEVTFRF